MFGKLQRRAATGDSNNPMIRAALRDASTSPTLLDDQLVGRSTDAMTVTGAINKTFILTALMLVTAAVGYANPSPLLMWGGAIGGFVMVLVGSFRPKNAVWAAPAYALFEGLFVGAISAIYAYQFDGIVLQATSLTVAVLLGMLFLYQSGIITVTAKLRAGIFMATAAVALVYLAAMVLGFFGVNMPFLHDGGPMGIGISVVILAIAAFNLLVDFDNFEKGAAAGLSSRYEWVFAMGLLVTVVWIYIELLRLISALSRD